MRVPVRSKGYLNSPHQLGVGVVRGKGEGQIALQTESDADLTSNQGLSQMSEGGRGKKPFLSFIMEEYDTSQCYFNV